MTRRPPKEATEARAGRSRRPGRWILGTVLLAVAVAAAFWISTRNATAPAPASSNLQTPAPSKQPKSDPSKLVGRWMRPDGGYVLELSAFTPDGAVTAGYFNPRPINVARAEWKVQDGWLGVFVELRDVNYPGSTYTLAYDPATDRLAGIYFQAAQRQRFEVIFQRIP